MLPSGTNRLILSILALLTLEGGERKHPVSSSNGGCCMVTSRSDACGFGWICRTNRSISAYRLISLVSGGSWKYPISSSNGGCCLADNVNVFIACSGARNRLLASVGEESPNSKSDKLLFVGSVGQIARFPIYLSWKEEHGNTQYHHLMVVVVLLTIEYLMRKNLILSSLFSLCYLLL